MMGVRTSHSLAVATLSRVVLFVEKWSLHRKV
jgi:hypothetical protein